MTMPREHSLQPDSEAATHLLDVVGPHAANVSRRVQQQYLGSLTAMNIIEVVDDDCLCTPEHIDQIEVEIWIGLNTTEKVFTQGSFSSHCAIAIQYLHCDRRRK